MTSSIEALCQTEGSFDLHPDIVPEMYVSFTARRLKAPRIVWLNERFFIERCVDITDTKTRISVEDKILEECAYVVPRAATEAGRLVDDPFLTDETRTFLADRYGAPGGTLHGGSGRCGRSRHYLIKGIGATPLCNEIVDWYHRHGCVWLEEAIRETIYSEVVGAEFPFGAVPVIAIIETGIRASRDDGSDEPMRALLVRPWRLRFAHLERSIFFGTSGSRYSDQHLDAIRVKRAIEECSRRGIVVTDAFERVAEQVGFGWAHRLFHGGYFSSNVCLDGSLVDFGSFRSLSSWAGVVSVKNGAPFGQEFSLIDLSIDDTCFYLTRYAGKAHRIADKASLKENLRALATERLRKELARLVEPIDELDRAAALSIRDALQTYVQEEQRHVVNYTEQDVRPNRQVCRLTSKLRCSLRNTGQPLRAVELLRSFGALGPEQRLASEHVIARLKQWLRPRRLLYRETLQTIVHRKVEPLREAGASEMRIVVKLLVQSLLARSRRLWEEVPYAEHIQGYTTDLLSYVLFCEDYANERKFLRIQGVMLETRVWVLGQWLNPSNDPILTRAPSGQAVVEINVDWNFRTSSSVCLWGSAISIPPPEIVFI